MFTQGELLRWTVFLPGGVVHEERDVVFLSWGPFHIRAWVLWRGRTCLVHRHNLNKINPICTNLPYNVWQEESIMNSHKSTFRIPKELIDQWRVYADSVDMNLTQFVIQAVKVGTPFLIQALSNNREDLSHTREVKADKNHATS